MQLVGGTWDCAGYILSADVIYLFPVGYLCGWEVETR